MYKECELCKEQGVITYYKNNEILAFCDECTSFLKLDDNFKSLNIYYDSEDFDDDIWEDLEEIDLPKEN